MSFISFEFYIFLFVVICLYFFIPHKLRWFLLLVASYYFYSSWNNKYILPIIISTVVSYGTAIFMERQKLIEKRKLMLCTGLCINLGILFIFKYFNFFIDILHQFFSPLPCFFNDIKFSLPVGISFYTFYLCGYLIDVFRGTVKAERHLGVFASSAAFFPVILAGPIERAKLFLPQFKEKHVFNTERLRHGSLLIMVGLFKKLVIADRLKIAIDKAYANPGEYSGFPLLVSTLLYIYQIYCDFSGYCDIAVGVAEIMGFNITNNFNRPFSSRSISELWRRWHISLSSWMRDYVYYPMVLNKHFTGNTGVIMAVFISFAILGLWHGANLTYILYGMLQGIAIAYELQTRNVRRKFEKKIPSRLYSTICLFMTLCYTCFTSIFFRASTLNDAVLIISNFFKNFRFIWPTNLLSTANIIIVLTAIMLLEFGQMINDRVNIYSALTKQSLLLRWMLYYIFFFSIITFGVFSNTKFIYFQF